MKRKYLAKLLDWKNSRHRKPLIVRGARQVGKTYFIREFGKTYYRNLILIDFEKNKSARKIFEHDFDITKIISLLEIEAKTIIIPNDTLIFLDEIQLCPQAIMALRSFFEDRPDLHVIAAGSLLEFEMEKIQFPVGRVEFLFMYPMTFAEMLMNTGHEALLAERPNLSVETVLPEYLHEKFLNLVKIYSVVGGMPEAVAAYVETQSFEMVDRVHQSLYQAHLQDLLKYEKNLAYESLRDAFDAIPKMIGTQIKYTKVVDGLSHYKTRQILAVLEKSMLIHRICSTWANALPLGMDQNDRIFKYLFVDIGLMQHICGLSSREILAGKDLLDIYRGAVSEQFAGQELLAAGGSQNGRLFYWSRQNKNSNAEVDFLFVRDGKIHPLEIKSGPSGKLKSLQVFLKEHTASGVAYVFNSGNVGETSGIRFRPIYTEFSLAPNL